MTERLVREYDRAARRLMVALVDPHSDLHGEMSNFTFMVNRLRQHWATQPIPPSPENPTNDQSDRSHRRGHPERLVNSNEVVPGTVNRQRWGLLPPGSPLTRAADGHIIPSDEKLGMEHRPIGAGKFTQGGAT